MRVEKYFAYEHLPPHLQAVSKPVCEWALAASAGDVAITSSAVTALQYEMSKLLPSVVDQDEFKMGLEKIHSAGEHAEIVAAHKKVVYGWHACETAILRLLLEAKDCFVRAAL